LGEKAPDTNVHYVFSWVFNLNINIELKIFVDQLKKCLKEF